MSFVRIFVTTSPINVLFQVMYCKQNIIPESEDYLIVYNSKLSQSFIEKLEILANQHSWKKIIYTSPISINQKKNNYNKYFKKITKKIQNNRYSKFIYFIVRSFFEKKNIKKNVSWISKEIPTNPKSPKELFILTEVPLINSALFINFPTATINYFEHGVSDYICLKNFKHSVSFHCLFDREFKNYLKNNNFIYHNITSNYNKDVFYTIAKKYTSNFSKDFNQLFESIEPEKKYALILLQDFENLGISFDIQFKFMDKICKKLEDSLLTSTLLIKPHPKQSIENIKKIEQYLSKKEISFRVLKEPLFQYTSIELFFYLIKSETSHVFSFYSSGLFYLSKLYPETNINYMYTFDYIEDELHKLSPELYSIHNAFINNQKDIFVKNCIEF